MHRLQYASDRVRAARQTAPRDFSIAHNPAPTRPGRSAEPSRPWPAAQVEPPFPPRARPRARQAPRGTPPEASHAAPLMKTLQTRRSRKAHLRTSLGRRGDAAQAVSISRHSARVGSASASTRRCAACSSPVRPARRPLGHALPSSASCASASCMPANASPPRVKPLLKPLVPLGGRPRPVKLRTYLPRCQRPPRSTVSAAHPRSTSS
jgi:hypothetical protein